MFLLCSSTGFLLLSLFAVCFPLFYCLSAGASCSNQSITCGSITLDIEFPFFTNSSDKECHGLHSIQCVDLVPAVRFYGVNYVYPVRNISYREKTITIHDLKLSSYFRGSNCDFVYDFKNPIQGFNFTSLSVSLLSSQNFFDCQEDYDFSDDIFLVKYNLSLCQNYNLHYFKEYGAQSYRSLPSACSAAKDMWFHWKLSFGWGRDGGGTSLLAVGFSPRWDGLGCFTCSIASNECREDHCNCSTSCHGKRKSNKGIIIGVSVGGGTAVFLLCCLICFIKLRRKRLRLRGHKRPEHCSSSNLLRYQSSNMSSPFSEKDPKLAYYQTHIFSYEELLEATNCFDTAMEVGDGGFGTVYRGKLRDGRAVAVKRLYENNFKRAEHFANEIVILSRLRHQNLVSLYGCTSVRSRELVLVYEFVPNGTVADHLHGSRAGEGRLTWPVRLSIAVETATALSYLHAIDPPIIHRDVKTGNILLDAGFHVKVADFGISRLFPPDGATHISTAPQGTPGYLDPEYHQCYQLTDRSDVYSFGVVLAELISSKPAVDLERDRQEINLSTMAMNRIQNGNMDELLDPKLGFDTDTETRVTMRLVAELAFRCLQSDRDMRPAIKEVLDVLTEIQSRISQGHSVEQIGNTSRKANGTRPISPASVTEIWVSRPSTPDSSQ
ncbi:hypothetical protein HPP92_006089 [Vanilla planifolia]|uniref:Protein kinase domain-containing protein n=1 Tax=Vanilla planifolia TaxID=51239 RepID=A0A835RML0_VANPL|nr:hypothetical protein HPP92_006404 [Vanilla planifolia]KAG0495095.1 hypothetical protein HPP92_006089 [Vanilla planifolia]